MDAHRVVGCEGLRRHAHVLHGRLVLGHVVAILVGRRATLDDLGAALDDDDVAALGVLLRLSETRGLAAMLRVRGVCASE